jgi:hypothetical protein
VVSVGKKFVLNTVTMSAAERAAAGLQTYDVTSDNSGVTYDHLPLVADFRFPSLPGDFNSDRLINSVDYQHWRARFGAVETPADANRNGIVDAADYVVWRKAFVAGIGSSGESAVVPEPASNMLYTMLVAILVGGPIRRSPGNP